jgi:hypothetical protein
VVYLPQLARLAISGYGLGGFRIKVAPPPRLPSRQDKAGIRYPETTPLDCSLQAVSAQIRGDLLRGTVPPAFADCSRHARRSAADKPGSGSGACRRAPAEQFRQPGAVDVTILAEPYIGGNGHDRLPSIGTGKEMTTGMTNRWMAEITYRNGDAPTVVPFEELADLHEIVEMWADWSEIEQRHHAQRLIRHATTRKNREQSLNAQQLRQLAKMAAIRRELF